MPFYFPKKKSLSQTAKVLPSKKNRDSSQRMGAYLSAPMSS